MLENVYINWVSKFRPCLATDGKHLNCCDFFYKKFEELTFIFTWDFFFRFFTPDLHQVRNG